MSASAGFSRPAKVAYFGVPALVLATVSANAELTVLAVASLLAIILLVWRQSEAQILLFACCMQWLQGSLKVFQADLLGVPTSSLYESRNFDTAIVLTLIWTVALAAGIRIGMASDRGPKISKALDSLTPFSLFRVYLIWTLFMGVATPLAGGGLWQIFVAIGDMRWAVVFALFWSAFTRKQHYGLVALVFAVELITGFFSFFSSFKTPIYLLALALPAGNYRIGPKHILSTLLVAAFALYLGIIWSAIKGEYRRTISGGTMEQTVTISRDEQAKELVRLTGNVDEATLDRGLTNLVDRIAYVQYFALAIDFVPSVREHEQGLLWGNALRHVLMPRLFFPDKPELESDTEIARRYTGAELTWNSATSIALGTPAESYVDYGVPFMFLPALCLGLLCCVICRRFAAHGTGAPLAQGFAVALFLPMSTLELTPSKALGGLLTRTIVAFVLWRFLPPLLMRMKRQSPLVATVQPR